MITHERRLLDRDGRPVEVVLPIAEFEELKSQAQAAEIIRRFAAGASLAGLSDDYGIPRVDLCELIAEHGLDPNRYDVEEVHRDQVTLAKLQGERSPGT